MTIYFTDATGKTGTLALPVNLAAAPIPPVVTPPPATTSSSPMPQPPGTTTLVQHDYFSGTALSGLWQPNIGTAAEGPWRKSVQAPLSAINAGGYDLEYFSPANIAVNGVCSLSAVRDTSQAGYSWRSACMRTGQIFTKGTLQYRAKLPSGNGLWPGGWMLMTDSSGEDDIDEGGYALSGQNPNSVIACNLHETGDSQDETVLSVDLTAAFHDYRVVYVPGVSLTHYVDEKLIKEYTENVPTGAYEFLFNLQVAAPSASGWHTVADATTPSPSVLQMNAFEIWE